MRRFPPTDPDLPDLLRTGEVAQRLGISSRTVQAWANAGKLPSIRMPGLRQAGHRRFRAGDVDAAKAEMHAAGGRRTAPPPTPDPYGGSAA